MNANILDVVLQARRTSQNVSFRESPCTLQLLTHLRLEPVRAGADVHDQGHG